MNPNPANSSTSKSVRSRAAETGAKVGATPRRTQARSAATRKRLCLAIMRLLEQKPLREIRIAELTKLASVSPATFYFHFVDVPDAVLGALEMAAVGKPDWAAAIAQFDPERDLPGQLRGFIRSFLEYWDRYYGILRARTLASDEGEPRFRRQRTEALLPVDQALEAKIDELHARCGVTPEIPSGAQAMVLMGSLERLGPVLHMRPTRPGASRTQLIAAAVKLFLVVLLPPVERRPANWPR